MEEEENEMEGINTMTKKEELRRNGIKGKDKEKKRKQHDRKKKRSKRRWNKRE